MSELQRLLKELNANPENPITLQNRKMRQKKIYESKTTIQTNRKKEMIIENLNNCSSSLIDSIFEAMDLD